MPHVDARCDAGLKNGRRCKNDATHWIRFVINLTGETEIWPVAVCESHRKPGGVFSRMGPDRRREYAEEHNDAAR